MATRLDGRLLWALVLAPVVVLVTTVVRHWVDVPYGDQWELPTDIRQIHSSGVDVPDLWRQHNEHRILFPRLAMLVLAWPTEFDSRAQMTLSLVLAFAALVLIVLLLRRTFTGLPRGAVVAAAVVTAVVLFSPMQYENWLWGFQISWFMNVLGVVAAAAVLTLWPRHRRPLEPVLLAVACALFAQYSLANGTTAWLCLAPLLIGDRYRRLLPLWAGVGVLSTGVYFLGYTKPAGHPPLTEIFRHPVEGIRYVCLFLGRTAFADRDVGVAVGAVLLVSFFGVCLVIGLRRRDLWPVAAPWICIAAYVLCSAAGAATGRAGFGIGQAAASRYTTIALLFLLATLVLTTLVVREVPAANPTRIRARATAAALPWSLVLVIFVADYPDQDRLMAGLEANREKARQCLLAVTSAEDPCLRSLYPRPAQVFPRIEFLRDLGWLPHPITNSAGIGPG